jgi:rRNA maturation endonuclease Nob1
MATVAGEYLRFASYQGVFVYRYRCERCGRLFRESAPEISAPALCHYCVTGNQHELFKARRREARRRKKRKDLP